MARKLATIQRIKELNPIPNADAIEVASVLGWKVVVKKGEFKVGDLVIYCEIDSILPDKPEFEFLRARKFRIRTVRLRGQISQGICFPLSILSDKDIPDANLEFDIQEGTDMTGLMGIEQWLPQIPACIAGEVKGVFPSFVPKTDETRVQVLQGVLSRFKGTKCYVTEKVDGSSATYYLRDGEFGVCSRNLDLKESEGNAFWQFAREVKLEEKLRSLGYNAAIQGELVGLGIQKNPLKIDRRTVLFFNAFEIDKFRYLDFLAFKDFIADLGLETVPILEEEYFLEDNIDALIKKATDKSKINPKVWREGIVIRPLTEKVDLEMSTEFSNGRVSFKAINPEYLLEIGE